MSRTRLNRFRYWLARVWIQCRRVYLYFDLVIRKDLVDPLGWIDFPLSDGKSSYIKTFMIQIVVLLNHQNGKDTHIRKVKILR